MKRLLYNYINKLGFGIYNKKKIRIQLIERYKKFAVNNNLDLLLRSSEFIDALDEEFKDLKIEDNANGLRVSFSNFIFIVESREEFLILKEIFVDQDYGLKINKDSILIDIGANVGMASIYFSQFESFKKIYAFEPVPDTFEIASRNLELNPIKQELKIFNFGLGLEDKEVEFLYNRWVKGNAGIRGKLSPSYRKGDFRSRTVGIKNSSDALLPILNDNFEYQIVVKMDCEGAEYEIIENLDKAGILQKIDVFMIEWHDYGAKKIEDVLIANGFLIFSRKLTSISGMLYAVKTRNREKY